MLETIKEFLARKKTTDLEIQYRGHQVWRGLDNKNLTPQKLREIQSQHGPDAATMVLYRHFRERDDYQAFSAYLDAERGTIYSKDYSEYVVMVLAHNPWQSLSHNEDYQWRMKNIAADAGFEVCYPEIHYRRSMFPNAYYYQDLLKRFPKRKVIFMTYGLASLEVRWLLERSQQLDVEVAGWLNVSGLLYGTSLPPSSEDWWYSLKRTFNAEHPVLPEVARSNSYCYGDFKFDLDFPMVSLLGLNTTKNFSLGDLFRDKELGFWGPHDGYVSHADYLKNPGIVWPLLGQGHSIHLESVKQRLQATFKWMVEEQRPQNSLHPLTGLELL